MTSFNIIIEEKPKAAVLSEIEQLLVNKHIDPVNAAGMRAIVEALPGKFVSIAFNGSGQPSGYNYSSWHSHDEERDVPTDEERMLPNEPGYPRDETGRITGPLQMDWAGKRTAAMRERLKREPRL